MNFVGSEDLQTVHLCMWVREAEGNRGGTTTAHKTNSIMWIIFLWHCVLPSSLTRASQGQWERAASIINVAFEFKFIFTIFWRWGLLLLFISWGFCFVYTDAINTILFSFPPPPLPALPRDFPLCNRYLITLELNQLLNPWKALNWRTRIFSLIEKFIECYQKWEKIHRSPLILFSKQ